MGFDYSSHRWRTVRAEALARDGHRCTVSRLLGGSCSPEHQPLHVHHIVPVEEGGPAYLLDNVGTSCSRHHPQWEALRRQLVRRVRIVLPCPECGLPFSRTFRLDDHLAAVHGVGVPEPDWGMNRQMVAALLGRLRSRREPAAVAA